MDEDVTNKNGVKPPKKKNRRRRNKKDVVLIFNKSSKKRGDGQAEVVSAKEFFKAQSNKPIKSNSKISLKTSSKDYDGTLGLPDTVTQREYETTGQFFRRIDRLIAKARIDANLETRFDLTLPHHRKSDRINKKVNTE